MKEVRFNGTASVDMQRLREMFPALKEYDFSGVISLEGVVKSPQGEIHLTSTLEVRDA